MAEIDFLGETMEVKNSTHSLFDLIMLKKFLGLDNLRNKEWIQFFTDLVYHPEFIGAKCNLENEVFQPLAKMFPNSN